MKMMLSSFSKGSVTANPEHAVIKEESKVATVIQNSIFNSEDKACFSIGSLVG